jgi:DNA polymerase III subunit epsilon
MAWAVEVASDPATVYLDTETTGLGPEAEIVDIAVLDGSGRILLETLVRPRGPIPREATRIHGLVAADVASAPTWTEVHDRLCLVLEGRRVVAYNARFDRRIVAQCCARHRLPDRFQAWECAMLAYAAFAGGGELGAGGHRWPRLECAAAAFGVPAGAHRAAADAAACRAVVEGIAGVARGR